MFDPASWFVKLLTVSKSSVRVFELPHQLFVPLFRRSSFIFLPFELASGLALGFAHTPTKTNFTLPFISLLQHVGFVVICLKTQL